MIADNRFAGRHNQDRKGQARKERYHNRFLRTFESAPDLLPLTRLSLRFIVSHTAHKVPYGTRSCLQSYAFPRIPCTSIRLSLGQLLSQLLSISPLLISFVCSFSSPCLACDEPLFRALAILRYGTEADDGLICSSIATHLKEKNEK